MKLPLPKDKHKTVAVPECWELLCSHRYVTLTRHLKMCWGCGSDGCVAHCSHWSSQWL